MLTNTVRDLDTDDDLARTKQGARALVVRVQESASSRSLLAPHNSATTNWRFRICPQAWKGVVVHYTDLNSQCFPRVGIKI